MVANVPKSSISRLANRNAEFPGQLQTASQVTSATENLAVAVLAHVQRMPITPAERTAEFNTRLTARLTAQGQDTSVVTAIVATAEQLDLFASEPTP